MISTKALKNNKQNIAVINIVNVPPVAVRYYVSPLYLRNCVAGKKSNLTNSFLSYLIIHIKIL